MSTAVWSTVPAAVVLTTIQIPLWNSTGNSRTEVKPADDAATTNNSKSGRELICEDADIHPQAATG